ncbi:hypothetical protein AC578_5092 [Pseudocercospora eumusae]|uniref:Uncharacterized protein n=1 Tax=Pseudocercospora eumusae TaxID=321146 RepID=A0A139HII8_9PEZI|nr:hypothetical protein AC578_5092 [Pseudocercospora eumusae]
MEHAGISYSITLTTFPWDSQVSIGKASGSAQQPMDFGLELYTSLNAETLSTANAGIHNLSSSAVILVATDLKLRHISQSTFHTRDFSRPSIGTVSHTGAKLHCLELRSYYWFLHGTQADFDIFERLRWSDDWFGNSHVLLVVVSINRYAISIRTPIFNYLYRLTLWRSVLSHITLSTWSND